MRPASRCSSTAVGIDHDDVADEPEVDGLAVDDRPATAGEEESGVLARDRRPEGAVLVDQADDVAADLPREHHPDDLHHLGRGDAVAAAEFAGDRQPLEHGGDLRSAAVHDDGPDAGVAEVDHVLGEGPDGFGVVHGVAAELHDDDLAGEALEPRQRLDQGGGLDRGLAWVVVWMGSAPTCWAVPGVAIWVVVSVISWSTRCSRARSRG